MNTSTTKDNPSKLWDCKDTILVVVSTLLFVLASLFYPRLPDQVISKFDLNGNPTRTMDKWAFWLLYGGLAILLPIVIKMTRNLDPRKANYSLFESTFQLSRWAVVLFIHFIFGFGIAYNLGYPVSMNMAVSLGLGILWIMIGNVMGRIRFTYFMGIRTPWTLASEEVWRRTHRFGGKCWFVGGLVMIIAAFFPTAYFLVTFITVLLLSTIIPTIYSYMLYRKGFKS
ncbi:SdpI family protein [Paenibacillus sp. GCM10027629]|uniref:SdpI family protein n=1 Tax=Paenibacillus sp. GCM10027629 TaxID=3273414 RepID=UPI00363F2C96